MPDQYGRPNVQDVAAIQSMYMKGSEFAQKKKDDAEMRITQKKTSEYLDQLSQGKNLDEIRGSDLEWNSKAGIAASASWTAMQRNSAELTKSQQEVELGKAMAAHRESVDLVKSGMSLIQGGNVKGGLEKYAEVFNTKLVDGRTAKVIPKDGGYVVQVTDVQGNPIQGAEAMTVKDTNEAMELLVGTPGKGGRTNFVTAWFKSKRDKEMAMLEAAHNPEAMKQKKDSAIVNRYNFIDPSTGDAAPEYYHTGEDRWLDPEEVKQMRLKSVAKYWNPQETHEMALRASKAKGLKGTGVDKPLSAQGKFASDLRDSYGFNKSESMDLALELRESETIGKQVQKMLAEGWEPDEAEVKNVLNSKGAQDIIKKHIKMKRDKKRPAKGLGKKKVKGKGDAATLKRLSAAKPVKRLNIPDGTTTKNGAYIVKNRKWTINK